MTDLAKILKQKGLLEGVEKTARTEVFRKPAKGRPAKTDDERRDAIVFLHKIGYNAKELSKVSGMSIAAVYRAIDEYFEYIGDGVDYVFEEVSAWIDYLNEARELEDFHGKS